MTMYVETRHLVNQLISAYGPVESVWFSLVNFFPEGDPEASLSPASYFIAAKSTCAGCLQLWSNSYVDFLS